jgi:hypothetical protein
MDVQGFKFTFYINSLDSNKEKSSGTVIKKSAAKMVSTENPPALADRLLQNKNLKVSRPLTHRNPRVLFKTKLSSGVGSTSNNEILRSKSYLKNDESKENANILQLTNSRNHNYVRLAPIVHKYKRLRPNSEFLENATKRK